MRRVCRTPALLRGGHPQAPAYRQVSLAGVLRIATFNVNGIRATQRRGFGAWLARRDCDVVALQEVRCPVGELPAGVFGSYHLTYDAGQLAGRNGVAALTRARPAAARSWGAGVLTRAPGDGHVELAVPEERGRLARELRAFATEGRYVEVDLADVPVTVASLYLPKGGLPAELQVPGRMREAPDGGAKCARKMRFLAGFARHLTAARRTARAAGREFLLMGDLNIAHTPLDVHHWRRQQRCEGFLPEERAWLDEVIGPRRLVDVVRRLHGDTQGPYTWWSWLGGSFENDSGWRIDYHLATPGLARAAVAAYVDREPSREERLSDHAPVLVDYAFPR
jgi:exodeoxyribonuclease-3